MPQKKSSAPDPPHGPGGRDSQFRLLIETIDDLILVADKKARVLYANPASSRKLGYSPEEMRELNILDLHPTWVREEAQVILGEMMQGRRESCPLPLLTKSGGTLPVETRIWFGEWDGQECLFGLCKDLSKEQELLLKFERLFRVNPAPMAISSLPDRKFLEINQAFEDVLGYSLLDVVGRTSDELNLTPDPQYHDKAARMLAEYGVLKDLEMPIRAKDGRMVQGLFSGTVIESQGQTVFLTVMIDVTPQKEAEREREQTIVELKSALAQIQTLKGILPICSCCKKIRDDKGYWEQVEGYIARHTQAEFSHGICPECKEKLYPGLG